MNNNINTSRVNQKSHYWKLVLLIFLIAFLLTQPTYSISGAKSGLLLWYQTVLPTLLPFFILTDYFIANDGFSFFRHLSSYFRNPIISYLPIIVLGILCGFPMGGKLINDGIQTGLVKNKITLYCLLAISNNASPMFLIGFLYYGYLENHCSLLFFLVCLYFPHILLFLFLLLKEMQQSRKLSITQKKNPFFYPIEVL